MKTKLSHEQLEELKALGSRIENWISPGTQHSGKFPNNYLTHFLGISREYGYATHDDSWNEFEKEFAIIVKRMIVAERVLEMLEIDYDYYGQGEQA